mmetsp:Transcript_10201/g.26269  ORF Transcript_10201/g.26269 Transcript_10201/m.26269 type:complete len:242 (-) Transcript_10201:76-801(-)|eukprot:CAMPEP_0183431456 /NCGR_PEP_ID=MMETSP0370-20130417/54830_1 /TAXON_ID=268820 /ORGANISM="Peridinium aciculiferum, Strain PAER-2" /LENGTH=241 /DNA_ID=CAMNT_0025617151 /DNA_START=92 /DNA_END=817 /DNA_ORIENTATION=+
MKTEQGHEGGLGLDGCFSEFIGTFFLVFTFGLNTLQHTVLWPISVGSILTGLIFCSSSGAGACHFNPAVTIGVMLCQEKRELFARRAFLLIIGQLMGGLVAGLTYYALFGATFGLQPGRGYNSSQAFTIESLFSAGLVLVVLGVAPKGRDWSGQYFGLAIGMFLAAAAFAVGGISGCALNPALALGVQFSHFLHTGHGLDFLHIYLFAPVLGALLAVAAFKGLTSLREAHMAQQLGARSDV